MVLGTSTRALSWYLDIQALSLLLVNFCPQQQQQCCHYHPQPHPYSCAKTGCAVLAAQPNGLNINMKMMKAFWLVLSSFLVLYLPALTVYQIVLFPHPPYPLHLLIGQAVRNVIVPLNNIINSLHNDEGIQNSNKYVIY